MSEKIKGSIYNSELVTFGVFQSNTGTVFFGLCQRGVRRFTQMLHSMSNSVPLVNYAGIYADVRSLSNRIPLKQL